MGLRMHVTGRSLGTDGREHSSGEHRVNAGQHRRQTKAVIQMFYSLRAH